MVGLGLVVGAFVGRARGLVVLGVLLTLLASAAAVADVPVRGGVGDRTWRPATVSDLHDAYRLGIGQAELDLTRLDLAGAGRTAGRDPAGRRRPADHRARTTSWCGSTPTSTPASCGCRAGDRLDGDRPVRAGRRCPRDPRRRPRSSSIDAELGVGSLEVRRATS